jgi:diaminopimelate decarboxylase
MNTPCYVIVAEILKDNLERMKKRLAPCSIFYSMKSNPSRPVAEVLAGMNCGFEVSSLAEARILRNLRVDGERIYCGLPVLTDEQVAAFLELGCSRFVYDTQRQLKRLTALAPNAQKILRLAVDDLSPGSIGFGLSESEVKSYPNLSVNADGLSFHISDHSYMNQTLLALERAERLIEFMPQARLLNIGGSYTSIGQDEDYEALRLQLEAFVNRCNLTLMCEPGSAVVNTAGSVLTRCVMVRERDGFTDVFLDGGIPAGVMRPPGRLFNLLNPETCRRHFFRFFDTTSMRRLLFQLHLKQGISEGDLLRLTDYGAYSFCYSNRFHSQPMPETLLFREEQDFEKLV